MQFDIVKTNIVNIVADAIVLPANEQLKEGTGTSKAIFEAAGRKELTKACKKIGHCDMGCAVPTLAYDLNSKYIVHTVVPKWIDGKHKEYELLSSAFFAAMNIADVMGCKTIAFPVLASGNNGFDKEIAVQIALECIEHFHGTSLEKIILVVYSDGMEKFMKSKGYSVLVIPENIRNDRQKLLKKQKQEKLLADGKEIAQKVLENQVAIAMEWMKNPKHQKMILDFGIGIVKTVFAKKLLK